jgi:lipopolysaccharide transport system permease protein
LPPSKGVPIAGSLSSASALFETNARNLLNTNINPVFYTLEEWSFQVQTFFHSFTIVAIALSFFQPSLFLHLFTAGLLPLFNLLLFAYWLPVLICLLGKLWSTRV